MSQKEVDAATLAFQIALSQVGVSTVAQAQALWRTTPVEQKTGTAQAWLRQAMELVMTQRTLARDLARAYYRLIRALLTGKTVPDPNDPDVKSVTLGQLRAAFNALIKEAAAEAGQNVDSAGPSWADVSVLKTSGDTDGGDSRDEVLIEQMTDILKDSAALDAAAEQELVIILMALGPNGLDKAIKELDKKLPHDEYERLLTDAVLQAGARQAAGASRVAMNGGRSELWTYMDKDVRVLGWARYSTTGTPCGWCAMLISRGAVYKSAESAQFDDGDLYHDNCHCAAIPVFSTEQYEQSAAFDLNRTYKQQWPVVTKGLSGKAAVSAWRRYIRQQQAAQAAA